MIKSERLKGFLNNRWLILVASMWIQSCAGVGYLFGSISPIIKSRMGYNQQEISYLGVSKNLGDCVGFAASVLSEILPFWGVLLIGVFHNFFGYGLLWLIINNKWTNSPLWLLCIAIALGTNGETYYNTAPLVSCVLNFPDNRGPVVGLLKGFGGLSGAIINQLYHSFSTSIRDSLILTIAIGPSIVVLTLMFAIRYVEGHRQKRSSDNFSFLFIYGVCLLLVAYLTSSLFLEDLSQCLIILLSIILLMVLLLPLIVPITLAFSSPKLHDPIEETFLPESSNSNQEEPEAVITEVENEDAKRKRGLPQLGENFNVQQALANADFWLMLISVVLSSGSGITVIDNIGQICESLGYSNIRIFVSIISICNFLGRVGGGFFSELVVRKFAYPRVLALAIAQVIIAIGSLYYAMGWPAAIYIVTVLTSFGYGAHWGITPAIVSELFGLKSFATIYYFFAVAMPFGSYILSTVLASRIYDYYAEKQAGFMRRMAGNPNLSVQLRDDDTLTCMGSICYSITCAILSGVLSVAVVLNLIVVQRTMKVYANLYLKS